MTLNRVTATDPNDKTRAQRTTRSYLCNDAELRELRPRLEAAGMVVTVTRETVWQDEPEADVGGVWFSHYAP